jgi:hypothetical protein
MRYPEQITDQELEKFKEPIEKIKSILSKSGGVPIDFEECRKVSRKISNVLQKYITEEESPTEDDSDDGGSGDGGDEGESSSSFSDGSEGEESSGDVDKFMEKLMDSMDESGDREDGSFSKFMEEMKSVDEIDSKGSRHSKVDYVKIQANSKSNEEYARVLAKIDMNKASVLGTLLRR